METITPTLAAISITSNITYLLIGGLVVAVIAVLVIIRIKHWYQQAGMASVSDLQNEKDRSEIIFNAIADGVVLFDEKGIIRAFNPAASLITGWPSKEAVGLDQKSVLVLTDAKGQTYDDSQNPLSHILKGHEQLKDNDAVLKTRSNKMISVSLIVTPLINDKGQFTGAVAVIRDVTSERNEERQRAEFISTASHEMRTPVAAIEGYLALALNTRVSQIDQKARNYLEKAHSSTQALGKLFQDLLTSAKAEDGRLVSHPVVVELSNYLEQLAEALRFAAEKKGLLVDFMLGSDTTTITSNKVIKPLYYTHVDPERLREVITNLFDNAVKYTETGKITIGLTGNAQVVQVSVHDTGPGIPPEDIPHLFQKFYRVDSSATRTIGGTGLGLFISRKIIELYNGRIWVESEVGKGSTFYINLPRLDAKKAEELQKSEALQNALGGVAAPPMATPPVSSTPGHDTITTNVSTL